MAHPHDDTIMRQTPRFSGNHGLMRWHAWCSVEAMHIAKLVAALGFIFVGAGCSVSEGNAEHCGSGASCTPLPCALPDAGEVVSGECVGSLRCRNETIGSDPACAADATIGPDGAACAYSPTQNDARCPAAYSFTYQGKSCADVGLVCAYPGAGDGMADGCFSTAVMWCRGDAGAGDGGADGGAGTWTVGQ